MANALTYQSEFTGPQMDERFAAVAQLQAALTEVETALSAKYVKPASGIPSTDLNADVNAALAKANSAIQSLADYYTKAEVDALIATINGQEYVDVSSLPTASASTMGKIYLVGPDGSGYYSYYYTSYDGSAYSWVGPLGTTQISLANYATKAELNQLEHELNNLAMTRYYGIFESAEALPEEASELGYAYVGTTAPLSIYEFNEEEWYDTGAKINVIQGEPGVGFQSADTQQDGTVVITLTDGNTITLNLNHNHANYAKYQLCTDETQYQGISPKDSSTLYLIPE